MTKSPAAEDVLASRRHPHYCGRSLCQRARDMCRCGRCEFRAESIRPCLRLVCTLGHVVRGGGAANHHDPASAVSLQFSLLVCTSPPLSLSLARLLRSAKNRRAREAARSLFGLRRARERERDGEAGCSLKPRTVCWFMAWNAGFFALGGVSSRRGEIRFIFVQLLSTLLN